jgi:hypothetical protein
MSAPPVPCVWLNHEGVFRPTGNYGALAAKHYGDGEVVALVPHEDRSFSSHRHFFAVVREAWLNLDEADTERFATPEALRKYALVRTGYRDERTIACASKAEALRVAAFVRPMDPYAVVTVSEAVVRVWTAQSQSTKAMGAKDFQRSKDDVMGFLAQMIGVDPASLTKAAA